MRLTETEMALAKRTKTKSEDKLLDQATAQLLRAVKEKARKTGRKLDRDSLLKQGYSERFIGKVEEA